MSLKRFIAKILGIDDSSEIYYSKGYNKGFADGYAKSQKEFAEEYEIISDEPDRLSDLTEKEEKIFKKLKRWRYLKAEKFKIEPYKILHDTALLAAIKARPQNTDELLEIKGFGNKNVEKYGKDLIKIINKEN